MTEITTSDPAPVPTNNPYMHTETKELNVRCTDNIPTSSINRAISMVGLSPNFS